MHRLSVSYKILKSDYSTASSFSTKPGSWPDLIIVFQHLHHFFISHRLQFSNCVSLYFTAGSVTRNQVTRNGNITERKCTKIKTSIQI